MRNNQWTPQMVEDRIAEALEWLRRTGKPDTPQMARGTILAPVLTLEERLGEGWDAVPEQPEEDEHYVLPDRERIALMNDALKWVGQHLTPIDADLGRAVNATCYARAYNRSIARVCREKGLNRGRMYNLKDRGLAILSVRLDRAGKPVIPARG